MSDQVKDAKVWLVRAGRDGEDGDSAPWMRVQYAVDKAYPKFKSDQPNLLVIADDLFVSLSHGTKINGHYALYDPDKDGRFASTSHSNLGGVGFFWVNNTGLEIWYEMYLFLNPYSNATSLPKDLSKAFHGVNQISDDSER